MNILLLNEYANNTTVNVIFVAIYLLIICCGIYIITAKNPIISVLFLILLFSIVACYLMQLTAYFIGLSYLLVYVGAVSILFLFILMLINVRVSELVTDNNNSIPLSLFVVTVFTIVFNLSIFFNDKNVDIGGFNNIITEKNHNHNIDVDFINEIIEYNTNISLTGLINNSKIYNVTGYSWDTFITNFSHIGSIGNILYTSYPILLLITSIILLLAMIGSIVITVKR